MGMHCAYPNSGKAEIHIMVWVLVDFREIFPAIHTIMMEVSLSLCNVFSSTFCKSPVPCPICGNRVVSLHCTAGEWQHGRMNKPLEDQPFLHGRKYLLLSVHYKESSTVGRWPFPFPAWKPCCHHLMLARGHSLTFKKCPFLFPSSLCLCLPNLPALLATPTPSECSRLSGRQFCDLLCFLVMM